MADEKDLKDDVTRPSLRKGETGATTAVDSYEITSSKAFQDDRKIPVFTVVAGIQTGLTAPLNEGPVTGGRDAKCELALVGRGISRSHFLVEAHSGSLNISDLSSTNGIYVNGKKVQQHKLVAGDRIHIGPETVLRFTKEPAAEVRIRIRQYEQSIRDELTGIYNRRYFLSTLKHELAFGERHNDYVSIVLLDVDNFKRVNDECGHPAGDSVIKLISERLVEQLRTEDIVARYGGEEFAIVLRGQSEERAFKTAERIREFVQSMSYPAGKREFPLTVSLGTSTLRPGGPSTPEAMIAEADRNLYEAKAQGRNLVVGTWKG